jgi:glucose-1-phosphate thymidylyltransferase
MGIRLTYAEQPRPRGLAEAFIIGADFIGSDRVAMVLGDNIFFGHGLPELLARAATSQRGATVFAYHVRDPERYGVVTFDENDRPVSIEEKLTRPSSNWAITGLYFFDNDVVRYASEVRPCSFIQSPGAGGCERRDRNPGSISLPIYRPLFNFKCIN